MCVIKSLFKKTTAAGIGALIAVTLCAEGLSLEPGIYDDTHQLILISSSQPVSKVYKTFNTFWYDGPHDFESAAVSSSPVAQIGDGLYIDFCIRYGDGNGISGIWLPGGNRRDLSVNGGQEATAKKERLSGYYITEDGQVYQIPFWLVNAEYNPEEKAFLTVNGSDVGIQKKVLVGGSVYTCTVGRSTRIRNPVQLDASMLAKARISSDGKVLSFTDPVYTRTSVAPENLDDLILQKNTTVYPPRFLWVDPKEPAIYKILEAQEPHLD